MLSRRNLSDTSNHGKTGESSGSSSGVLLSMSYSVVLMIPRSNLIVFSMSPFDDMSAFTASSVATSALHISATRLLNAMIAGTGIAAST